MTRLTAYILHRGSVGIYVVRNSGVSFETKPADESVKYGRNTLRGVRVVDTPTSDFLGTNNAEVT